jgi:hypothetical protein
MERSITFNYTNLDKHSVDDFEATEAFTNGWKSRRKVGANYEVLGQTAEGRYLQLIVEVTPAEYYIFHGRDMNDSERRRYRRK